MAEAELHGQRFTQHWGGGHERRSGTSEASLGYGEPVWRGWGVSDLSHLRVPAAPPSTLNLGGAHRKRKTLVAPEINISLDQSEGSLLSDDFLDTPDDLDINVDDIETPDETDSLEFLGNGNELEWEGNGGVPALSPSGFSPATSSSAPPPPPHYSSGRRRWPSDPQCLVPQTCDLCELCCHRILTAQRGSEGPYLRACEGGGGQRELDVHRRVWNRHARSPRKPGMMCACQDCPSLASSSLRQVHTHPQTPVSE